MNANFIFCAVDHSLRTFEAVSVDSAIFARFVSILWGVNGDNLSKICEHLVSTLSFDQYVGIWSRMCAF